LRKVFRQGGKGQGFWLKKKKRRWVPPNEATIHPSGKANGGENVGLVNQHLDAT